MKLFALEQPKIFDTSVSQGDNINETVSLMFEKYCATPSLQHHTKALDLIHVESARTKNKFPRILCFVHTISPNHHTKIRAQRDTWGRRCDKFLIISNSTHDDDQDDTDTSAIFVDIPLVAYDHAHLWDKTRKCMEYLWKYYPNYDYYFKADDDTYLIPENLKAYIVKHVQPSLLDKQQPVLMGHRFMLPDETAKAMTGNETLWNNFHQAYGHWVYFSGGGGYAFNNRALRTFVQHMNDSNCFPTTLTTPEDAAMAFCLTWYNNAWLINTRDSRFRERFHWMDPGGTYSLNSEGLKGSWIDKWHAGVGGVQSGEGAISSESITFHYVQPHAMYFLDAQLYRHCQNSRVPDWFLKTPLIERPNLQ
jgi:glycoprotein-N-acetylgalactosamine 3-beta-galactosyltransferase